MLKMLNVLVRVNWLEWLPITALGYALIGLLFGESLLGVTPASFVFAVLFTCVGLSYSIHWRYKRLTRSGWISITHSGRVTDGSKNAQSLLDSFEDSIEDAKRRYTDFVGTLSFNDGTSKIVVGDWSTVVASTICPQAKTMAWTLTVTGIPSDDRWEIKIVSG